MSSIRQLSAIMFTDIVGYTALMQQHEELALKKLHRFKEELQLKAGEANGEIIQYYGDGCLIIFKNAVDAVQCAKNLQEEFSKDPQVPVRIGIHLGDILIEEGNIFGDCVNISSRIESMGVPGAILVSDTVKKQIKNKPEFQLTSLGNFEFKNVDEPMEVLALSNPGFPVPNKSELYGKFKVSTKTKPWYKNKIKLAAAVLFVVTLVVTGYFINKPSSSSDPGKSIAVLAFTDMSPDKSQEYLGDGLADDIITALSSIKDLKVTGRTSSFQFKGKNTDLREIGEKLDVSVILEGSVQKSGNSIRVTAQLIDANDGKHIWSQKWDREMTDIFKIQDEIATGISNKLKVTILKKAGKENQKVNSASYELFLQGRVKFYSGHPLDRFNSKEYFLKSIKIDSSNSNTYAYLSLAYEHALRAFPPTDPAKKKLLHDSAYYYAEQSIRIDPENSMAYIAKATWMAGYYNWIEIDRLYRKAHELNPGATEKEEFSGFLTYMGYEKETLKLIDEALQLEPLSESVKSSQLLALQQFRKFDECITTAKKYLEQDSTNINYWTQLAYAYAGKNQYRLALDAWSHQHDSYGNKELAYIYRTSDLKTAFLTWVEHSKSNKVYVPNNLTRAFVFSMLGDKKTSIDYLELAVANNEYGVARIKTSWYFDLLRNETRFKELYRKLNFDAYDEYKKSLKR